MHIHSKYSSDGILDVKEIIKTAIKRGLDGIAITDHNTIKGGMEAKKYKTANLEIIVGSEIMTEKGEIIGLFLTEEITSNNLKEVIQAIKDQDGIIIIPHPFDEKRHSSFFPGEKDEKFYDGIEAYNSRCIFQKYNENAIGFAKKFKLAITAGSDAHFGNEIGNAGIITEKEDIREAIRKNDIRIFGNRTLLTNHGLTKVLKLWRKTGSYI